MAVAEQLTMPNPVILRKKAAAKYLGMTISMFQDNINDGVIEAGAKLRPCSKTSTALGWSVNKLERARATIDGDLNEDPFAKALESFNEQN